MNNGVWVIGSYDYYFSVRTIYEVKEDALNDLGDSEVMQFVPWGESIPDIFGLESELT